MHGTLKRKAFMNMNRFFIKSQIEFFGVDKKEMQLHLFRFQYFKIMDITKKNNSFFA